MEDFKSTFKRCPFCGSWNIKRGTKNGYDLHWIFCANCHASTGVYSTPKTAETWWNKRLEKRDDKSH